MSYQIRSLPGLSLFSEVHQLQKELLEKRVRDEIPDTLLFLEHKPVITRGRGLQRKPGADAARQTPLLQIPEHTEYVEIERGGDLTWHGPGQFVIYPILKLGGEGAIGKSIGQDVDRYIRFLENLWIDLLREDGLELTTRPHGSGVWRGDRKLASVGIALRRWVSYHGIAMNVVNDLSPFYAFDPCGYSAETMTRLKDQPGLNADGNGERFGPDWRSRWENRMREALVRKFGTPLV